MLGRMEFGMREPTFLILVALADAERHGYGIIQEVAKLSGGRLKLGPGSLYGALDRLNEQDLIRATRTESVNGRLRRYYAINDSGLSAVRQEAAHRAEVVRATNERLRVAPA